MIINVKERSKIKEQVKKYLFLTKDFQMHMVKILKLKEIKKIYIIRENSGIY
jgi:hypothetical protein